MNYLKRVEDHLNAVVLAIVDPECPMLWSSALDVETRRYPEAEHIPGRTYRLIGAPRGSTLYWDQPGVVAAKMVSRLTGRPIRTGRLRYVELS